MATEGDLTVRLDWDRRTVRRVSVRSTRPVHAARVLEGRTPADAVATVSLLFSVCARAQTAAAAGALEAAQGASMAPRTRALHERRVLLETIQEYLRRILVDGPEAMGRRAAIEPVVAARRRIASAGDSGEAGAAIAADLAGLAGKHVYGCAPDAWLARMDADAIETWACATDTVPARMFAELLHSWPTLGRSDVALMPAAPREALEAAVLPAMRSAPSFAVAPTWDGIPVETGALARMHGHPLVSSLQARFGNAVVTRMAARLAELAVLLGRLGAKPADGRAAAAIDAFALAPDEGLAAVQTARGLLLHRARVAGGRVAAYQIVAPTEWNFHAAGPLARGLAGMTADDAQAIERGARLAVQALDPCVACAIEVGHA